MRYGLCAVSIVLLKLSAWVWSILWCPSTNLRIHALNEAETMMERSPLALRMIKAGLNAELDGQAGIQELAGDATMLYYFLDEAQEGGKAFLEKRKPDFQKYPKMP